MGLDLHIKAAAEPREIVQNHSHRRLIKTSLEIFGSTAQMKVTLFLLVLACGAAPTTGVASQWNEMIQLTTVTYSLVNFTDYGCHCGPGMQGSPMDTVDRYCHSHDCCYNKAEMFGCNPNMHTYRFYVQRDNIMCVKSRDRCEKLICECDQKAASCFWKHLFTYDSQFKNHPANNCRAQRTFC